MSLADNLRRAREKTVEAGGFKFTIRRPTEFEMASKLHGRKVLLAEFMPFVIGWEGVRELDIMAGGDPHPLEFDPSVRDEWLGDNITLLSALADEILKAWGEYIAARENRAKN